MAHIFENIKTKIVGYFRTKNRTNEDLDDIEKKPFNANYRTYEKNDPEESLILLDETEKKNMKIQLHPTDMARLNTFIILQSKRLPLIYFTLNITLLLFMATISYFKPPEEYSDVYSLIGHNKVKFLNFFHLNHIHPFCFHILNTGASLTGGGVVLCIFLYMKMQIAEYSRNALDCIILYIATTFGLFSAMMQFFYGNLSFFSGFEYYNSLFFKEVHITLSQFVFLLEIFFSILFAIFITILMVSVKSKSAIALDNQSNLNGNKWLDYKLLTIIYLIFFSLSYILIQLHNQNVIFPEYTNPLLLSNYSYLIAIIPYIVFILNTVFYTLFYDDLRTQNITISQPKDKTFYEEHQKNIL